MATNRLVNRVVLGLVGRRRLHLCSSLVGLEVRGRRTGRVLRFPVQYAECADGLVVVPAHAQHKTWWRNLRGGPVALQVLWQGDWRPATGEVVMPDDDRHADLGAAYTRRWSKMDAAAEPVVHVVLGQQ